MYSEGKPRQIRSLKLTHARTSRQKNNKADHERHSLEMALRLLPPKVRQLGVQQRGFELVEEFLETSGAVRAGHSDRRMGGKAHTPTKCGIRR